MRQQYETDKDRENERTIIETMLDSLNRANGASYEVIKLTKKARLDYALLKYSQDSTGTSIAFCEVKRRKHRVNKYPDLMISASKFQQGQAVHLAGFPFIIVIKFEDSTRWYRYEPSHEGRIIFKHSGRTLNTRDKFDKETCAHIPIDLFVPLVGTY